MGISKIYKFHTINLYERALKQPQNIQIGKVLLFKANAEMREKAKKSYLKE
jgi:hypothetical protein